MGVGGGGKSGEGGGRGRGVAGIHGKEESCNRK